MEVMKLERPVLERIQSLVPLALTSHPDRQRSFCFLVDEAEQDHVAAMNRAIGTEFAGFRRLLLPE